MKKGFTLIELMIVIAIIGILTSIGIVSFSQARGKANDAKRRADLKTLQTALEQYYSDNGSYPTTSGWNSSQSDDTNAGGIKGGNWLPGLVPQYMKQLPYDPVGGASNIQPTCSSWKKAYLYQSNGQQYVLLSHCAVEATVLNNPKDALYDPVRPAHAWKVCAGAAACATW